MTEEPMLSSRRSNEDLQKAENDSSISYETVNPLILNLAVVSSKKVNVKLSDDEFEPSICGCDFLPNGKLLLTDSNNRRVKLLDSSFVVEDCLTFLSLLWDVTVIDNHTAIVTLPNENVLKYIQVSPTLKKGRTISIRGVCRSVKLVGEELFICCWEQNKGEIRVLDLQGTVKRRLGVNADGSRLFEVPHYIDLNSSSKKIYVTDWSTHQISCLTMDGTLVYQYKDCSLDKPHGIFVDVDDNVMVCSENDNNVQVITAEGKKFKTLLSGNDGLIKPRSITYRPRDRTLVVGCHLTDHLMIFELH